jgi:hypothetical protein
MGVRRRNKTLPHGRKSSEKKETIRRLGAMRALAMGFSASRKGVGVKLVVEVLFGVIVAMNMMEAHGPTPAVNLHTTLF